MRQPQHVPQQRRRRIHLQGEHLALDRPHRRQIGGRDAGDLARPGAGRQHHNIGTIAAPLGDDARGAPAGDDDLAHRAMLDQLDPGMPRGDRQRLSQQPVLDLVIAGAEDGRSGTRFQMRLALSRLGGGQPLQVEPKPFLEFIGMAQLGCVVAIERDDQRALVAVIDRDAAGPFQLACEIGPQALAFERQRQERLLPRLRLDRRSEHAGGRPAGTAPGVAAVVHGDRAAGLCQPPRDTEADDPGADDDRLRTVRWNDNRRANDGLPSPGKPGQVQWVCSQPSAPDPGGMPDGTPASAQFQADPRGDARIFCRKGYPGR